MGACYNKSGNAKTKEENITKNFRKLRAVPSSSSELQHYIAWEGNVNKLIINQ
jgi:hypothetical protein